MSLCVKGPSGGLALFVPSTLMAPPSRHGSHHSHPMSQGDAKMAKRCHGARKVIEKGFSLWKSAWGCGFRCSTPLAHNPGACCLLPFSCEVTFSAWCHFYNPCPLGPLTLEDYLFSRKRKKPSFPLPRILKTACLLRVIHQLLFSPWRLSEDHKHVKHISASITHLSVVFLVLNIQ